ncbi:MAG: 50S ribosomal protein L29 [Gammaproteobacteria bacterium]|jgi:large subunit ribosomal protein L29|nr:50S ribosomal protein L29 [Gammaproteobacteria bacterium]MBT4462825.1 50S ribosomal protein L29 [Gammaproteobacteria bacterium]MBT4655094.1 50S ribosomal protein L29 [Gammaproteobacteria bacterium]MBT7323468.1 50S ribosomal protein L29 [Gammaproteobacteria bacterium]MBT7932646.1 50S ribosomal protein L29 [Gammaproteobacteria bacterium]
MNAKEYREKTSAELTKELEVLVKERFTLRIQRGTGLNPKPHLFSINKKSIARIKTILNEKKLDGK